MILEWKEYMNWYGTEYEHKWWGNVSAVVTKSDYSFNWCWITVNYNTEEWIQYSYNINSPLTWDEAKEFAEVIIFHFNPELVPYIKNPKPEISEYEDWAIFKYEDKKNCHEIMIKVSWKRSAFVRVSNKFSFWSLVLNYSKRIKLKKVDDKKEFVELWRKEWENFNLYIPQIDRILNKFEILRDVKDKIMSNGDYLMEYKEIDEKVDDYAKYLLKETANYFIDDDYSNEPDYDINEWEEKLANRLKVYLQPKTNHKWNRSTKFVSNTPNQEVETATPSKKWLKWWQWILIILWIIFLISLS